MRKFINLWFKVYGILLLILSGISVAMGLLIVSIWAFHEGYWLVGTLIPIAVLATIFTLGEYYD